MVAAPVRRKALTLGFWVLGSVGLLAVFVGYLVFESRSPDLLDRIVSQVTGTVGVALLAVALVFGVVMTVRPSTFAAARPQTLIDALDARGPVQLDGTAETAGWTVESPFTGTECLACRWEIEKEERTYRRGELITKRWNVKAEGEDVAPFVLSREDGDVFVATYLGDLELQLAHSRETTVETPDERPPHVRQFFEEHDLGLDSGRQRFREYYLVPGDELLVKGSLREPSGFQAESKLRLPAGVRAVLGPPSEWGPLDRLNPFRVWKPFFVSNYPSVLEGDGSDERSPTRRRAEGESADISRRYYYHDELRTAAPTERHVRRLGVVVIVTVGLASTYWYWFL